MGSKVVCGIDAGAKGKPNVSMIVVRSDPFDLLCELVNCGIENGLIHKDFKLEDSDIRVVDGNDISVKLYPSDSCLDRLVASRTDNLPS